MAERAALPALPGSTRALAGLLHGETDIDSGRRALPQDFD